jgi:glucose/arabinose dehydrogenase/PKD repeat protein
VKVRFGLLACLLAICTFLPSTAQATVPAGFQDQLLAAISSTTGVATVPDGRVLVTTQLGQVLVYKNGALNPTPAIDLGSRLCTDIERGLVGIAVDPAFADQHYVYLYYTNKGSSTCSQSQFDPANQPVNRVSRFVLGDNDLIDPGSETVLVDGIPSPSGNHIAGDLHFGKDGYLYVSVGDGGCDYSLATGCGPANGVAQYPNVLSGKILRITFDGGVPPDNPHVGAGSARCNVTGRTTSGTWCQEIYALGLRNPFRFAMDPNASTTRFFINDVGLDTWEEIDLGAPDANYGWNVREGHCARASTTDCGPPPQGMTNPIYDYDHSSTGCASITAGAFVPRGLWPTEYNATYLFGDFVCGRVWQLIPDQSGGYTAVDFASSIWGVIAFAFAQDGSPVLYYVNWYPGATPAGLHRIVYTGNANRTPLASATASPTNGSLPLTTNFDGSQSSDPDNDALSFDWDFGDGSPHASTAQATHTYTTAGTYTAKLTVSDGHGGTDSTSLRIDAGNRAPQPSITVPASGQEFSVGQTISLTGSATDPEDGFLTASALTWQVVKHHASHTHPFLPPTSGNGITITGPAPEDLLAATNSYLEIRLTATDSKGLSTTVTRDMRPHLVQLSFATDPAGLRLEANGEVLPQSFTSWEAWDLQVYAPDQVGSDGKGEAFVSWSDAGAQQHVIRTPATPASYSAKFTQYYPRPRGVGPTRAALVPAFAPCTAANRTHGAPLSYGSCAPARKTSDNLTLGTPDANGHPANSLGYVRLTPRAGDPSTSTDEADVRIAASISDVFDAANLVDYVGELRVSIGIRLTDRQNGPSGTDSATVTDFPLAVTFRCAPTPGPEGSTCEIATTADAVTPGMVTESKRAIWQTDAIKVYDGGSDGLAATDPNQLFATQGLFLP